MPTTFGERLRTLRNQRGLSLDKLATKSDISRAYLWKLERKPDVNPSIELIEKLATALEVMPAELLGHQASGENVPIPAGLKELQEEQALSGNEVKELAAIRFRGRSPATKEDWHLLYLQLKKIVGNNEDET